MDEIWTIEESLWLGGADAYRARLAPHCLMAFPQVGVLSGSAIIDSLAGAPRWAAVSMDDRASAVPTPDIRVLAYHATASRDTGAPYRALCTSTYVRLSGAWKITQHQQTPEG
jgi:hypothetical protein